MQKLIYTPEPVVELHPNQIFVYGSNTAGIHGAGAAKHALKWGAKFGQDGFNGWTYGISTKDNKLRVLPLDAIKQHVTTFFIYAERHPQYEFLVTKIGTGLAGYKVQDIAPLFFPQEYTGLQNIVLPKEFWDWRREIPVEFRDWNNSGLSEW